MACQKSYDLFGYLQNELAQNEFDEIGRHLAGCSDCQSELIQLKKTIHNLKALPQIQPSDNFKDKVMAKARLLVHESEPLQAGFWDYLKASLRYAPPWAISAVVHFFIFVALSFIFIGPEIQKNMKRQSVTLEQMLPMLVKPTPEFLPEMTDNKLKPHDITPPPSYESWYVKGLQISIEADNRLINHLSMRTDSEYLAKLRRQYGMQDAEKSVSSGLQWLAGTQSSSGAWESDKYGGQAEYSVAVTGLTILSFLTEGNTHISGKYSETVNKGINYLISAQNNEGIFGPKSIGQKPVNYMYNHSIATAALIEDYLMTKNSPDNVRVSLERSIQLAVDFSARAQAKNGGWGYTAENPPDTSVTVWQSYAMKLAQLADIPAAGKSLAKTWDWWLYVTDEDGYVGYDAPKYYPNGPNTLTAAAMFCRLFANQSADELTQRQLKLIASNIPVAGNASMESDVNYWQWASLSLFLNGGQDGNTWNLAAKELLIASQNKESGSWPLIDRWGGFGGQVYATAMSVLTLQTCYRYPAL
ncbi:MAG: prenyltransferase/squalene oxidase repeat-containing protein [Planctomycetota bacterium]